MPGIWLLQLNLHITCVPKGIVVTFDWRGFGESDNWPTTTNFLCYPEFFKDINAVVDTVKTLREVDSKNIGIYGFSILMGDKEIWIVKNVGHGVEWDKSIGLKKYIN